MSPAPRRGNGGSRREFVLERGDAGGAGAEMLDLEGLGGRRGEGKESRRKTERESSSHVSLISQIPGNWWPEGP